MQPFRTRHQCDTSLLTLILLLDIWRMVKGWKAIGASKSLGIGSKDRQRVGRNLMVGETKEEVAYERLPCAHNSRVCIKSINYSREPEKVRE